MHFFNIPKLGSYFAVKLNYTSYLNDSNLKEAASTKLASVQNKAQLKASIEADKEKFEKEVAEAEEEQKKEITQTY